MVPEAVMWLVRDTASPPQHVAILALTRSRGTTAFRLYEMDRVYNSYNGILTCST